MIKNKIDVIPTTYYQNTSYYHDLLLAYQTLGIKTLRINCTRASVDDYIKEIEMLNKISKFDLLLDFPLPKSKPRIEFKLPLSPEKVGRVVGNDSDFYLIQKEQIITISSKRSDISECLDAFYVTESDFIVRTQIGETVIIGEHELVLRVIDKQNSSLKLVALHDGVIPFKKYVFSESCKIVKMTDNSQLLNYKKLIEKVKPNILALSFVECAEDIVIMKKVLSLSPNTKIMSKIETGVSVENLEEIIEHSDSLMIARGDMLNQVSEYEFSNIIDNILKINNGRKPIYVATGILSSLSKEKLSPSRAELTDIYYYLKNNVDGFILTYDVANEPVTITKCVDLINNMITHT